MWPDTSGHVCVCLIGFFIGLENQQQQSRLSTIECKCNTCLFIHFCIMDIINNNNINININISSRINIRISWR